MKMTAPERMSQVLNTPKGGVRVGKLVQPYQPFPIRKSVRNTGTLTEMWGFLIFWIWI